MSNNDPLLTIIVGTYKRPSSLKKTIDSILNQTYHNFIFYIVDDNHPEDYNIIEQTREIIYMYRDERIKYISNNLNIGVPFVYKKWLDLVKTKYYLIGGDGDEFEQDAIERYVDFLEKNPNSSLVYGLEKFVRADGSKYEIQHPKRESGEFSAFKHLHYYLNGASENYGWGYAMYRTDFYKVKNVKVTHYHFWDHYYRCIYLLFSENVGYINDYLVFRHIDTNLNTWARQNSFINRIERLIQTSKFIDEFEVQLIQKKYQVSYYRFRNALKIVKYLGYCQRSEEFNLAARVALGDIFTVISIALLRVMFFPLLKVFKLFRKY